MEILHKHRQLRKQRGFSTWIFDPTNRLAVSVFFQLMGTCQSRKTCLGERAHDGNYSFKQRDFSSLPQRVFISPAKTPLLLGLYPHSIHTLDPLLIKR